MRVPTVLPTGPGVRGRVARAGSLPSTPTWSTAWEVTPVDTRSRVDIRADDVPDGINAADHAAGLSSSLNNLAAPVEH
jgi:hypothetical protein